MEKFFEKQYKILEEVENEKGLALFGNMSSFTWNSDPKRLLFVLSRYKFAARMLEDCERVLEVGCGDGFASRIVKQHVKYLLITDADEIMIRYANSIQTEDYPISTMVHNFCNSKLKSSITKFDGIYLLDVLEHINKKDEDSFLRNIIMCGRKGGKVVIGMPSMESQVYASEGSKQGHVNCKTKEELYEDLSDYFTSILCFSMNDEVIHTGYNRMSNYLFAVCTI